MDVNALTYKIIGCAMETHRELGNGFQELIYQRALAYEMEKTGLAFDREKEMDIYYKGVSIGKRRVDFLVEGVVMVELKALFELEEVHYVQGINYLEAYQISDGLLINFGNTSLQYKRLFNNKLKKK